jgi:secondary thiamine-phosphate synthase enzyme
VRRQLYDAETSSGHDPAILSFRRPQSIELKQSTDQIEIDTTGQGLVEITRELEAWVAAQGVTEGLLSVFCRHTSASLLINENAAPAVQNDLKAYFARIAPEDPTAYAHNDEGPDDMPAHIRAALTGVSLSIPVIGGRPALGTWQGVFLFEHRRRPQRRRIALHISGE